MTLQAGVRLGSYEIVAPIGAGGMGEVYRARDLGLQRDVALKILPEIFTSDPDRLARFEREAQLLASLNHPNIAIVHGLAHDHGVRAIVMELVDGPTLADRLVHGAIPLEEALPIARQMAEALEAAHDRGIVHRDLKPANVKVTLEGKVKVLDFGLAKLEETSGLAEASRIGGVSSLSMSPTIASPAGMTGAGMILGTAAYMSPEQARGKPADRRADIWAFGGVLFEMLTGTQAFDVGETVSDAVAAILKNEPDWSRLPEGTPASIRTLLRRCLTKDPQQRLPHIGLARIEIVDGLSDTKDRGASGAEHVTQRSSRWVSAMPWAIAALGLGLAAIVSVMWAPWRTGSAPPEMHVEVTTPPTSDAFSFAISPDAQRLVFVATDNGQPMLWLRPMSGVAARPLPGTEGASYPFWSPDSRSVAFFANARLMRLDIEGGLPRILARGSAIGRGGTWSKDGVIIFAAAGTSGLDRVLSSGGEAVSATTLGTGHVSHRFPQFLPDGRRFVFYVQGLEDIAGIYLGSLDGGTPKRLTPSDAAGRYVFPGWLMFVREGALVARRFDAASEQLVGDPVIVADQISVDPTISATALSAEASSLITYRAGGGAKRQLAWFDRSGKMLGTMGGDDDFLLGPELSPDGQRAVVTRTVQRNTDIWTFDALRTTRFTFDAGADEYPHWSADGKHIVYRGTRSRVREFFKKESSGAEAEEALFEVSTNEAVNDWSPDGRFLLYIAVEPKTLHNLWVLPLDGPRKPSVFLNSTFTERNGQFSPDGRWIAYQSDESNHFEIYVRPFPNAGGQWQVSTAGGVAPRWRADGKELYYVGPNGTLMAAPITTSGAALDPGTPTSLFRPRIVFGGSSPVGTQWQYDVAPDGRFLINVTTEGADNAPIEAIVNWNPDSSRSSR